MAVLCFVFLLFILLNASSTEGVLADLPSISAIDSLGRLMTLELSKQVVCNVLEYGALDNNLTVNTEAIQNAINNCSLTGGVVAFFKENLGIFVSGSFYLKSNIVLYIDEGVTLLGSPDKSNATYPQIYTRVAGTMQYGHASLINGGACLKINYDPSKIGDQCEEWSTLENVTLAGLGTIDGNGDSGWWNPPYDNDRPTLLGLLWINGLTIRDLTLVNPPFWTVHPTFCLNVYAANLNITTVGPNTDGFDPDSTSHVLLEDSYISTGDDCIAIKSGKNLDGMAVGIPSTNITIRNCTFGQGHGLSIGSEMSGNVTDVLFSNLTLVGTQRGPRIKSAPDRGGMVANIVYQQLVMTNLEEGISVDEFYDSGVGYPPIFTNFTFMDIVGQNIQQAGEFDCLSYKPCSQVVMDNVQISGFSKGFSCSYVSGASSDVSPPSCL